MITTVRALRNFSTSLATRIQNHLAKRLSEMPFSGIIYFSAVLKTNYVFI